MSVIAGPDIVTDGLVICLDSANDKSYPGSGTVWYDIASKRYNCTLTNVSLTTQDGVECMDINASGETIRDAGTTFVYGNEYSLVAWAWSLSDAQVTTWRTLFRSEEGNHQILIQDATNLIGYYTSIPAGGFQSFGVTANNYQNKWVMYAVVASGGVSTLYLNGQKISSVAYSSAGLTFDAIGNYSGATQPFGYVASAYIYNNKALTDADIKQNFDATRGRFSL